MPESQTTALAGQDSVRGMRGAAVVVWTLLGLAAAKVVLAVALYDPAWIWLHQDDYCRALMAQAWGRSPYLCPSDLHWLPLPFYVYGLASRIDVQEQQLLFVVVSQLLAALTLVPVYRLGRAFFSRAAGLLAAGLYTFTAWQIVMSFSVLAEPVYYFVTLLGLWCFARWWTTARLGSLAGAAVFLGLAALTRYEAWLLLVFVNVLVGVRLWRARPPRREAVAVIALALAPWLIPALWIFANLRMHGVLLAFYSANRQAFTDALYDLTRLQRITRYPTAFAALSVPLTGLLLLALARFRSWGLGRAAVLVVIAVGHLAAMTVLYVTGSGPLFVERIVLFHLLLLIPIGGAALAAAWDARRPIGRTAVVAFVAAFVAWECYRSHDIIASRRHSDYRHMGDDYRTMSELLRAELPTMTGDAAVHCHDSGHYVRFSSGMPFRIHAVTGEDIEQAVTTRNIEMLGVPVADLGAWRVDDRIERVFRAAHGVDAVTETRLGNWRILRVKRGAARPSGDHPSPGASGSRSPSRASRPAPAGAAED